MKIGLPASLILLVSLTSACQNAPNPSSGESAAPGASQQSSSAPAQATAEKPAPASNEVELPAGTVLHVRLDQALSTADNHSGDTFSASLSEPVMVASKEVLPKNTRFKGHITTADSSGRLQGRGVLGITLDSFELQGETYPVKSSLDTKTTEAHKKRNLELIGGGAGVGALIGGLIGHGKGAAIGAAAGAAGGTGAAAATGKKDVNVPAETVFQFTLKAPVKVKA